MPKIFNKKETNSDPNPALNSVEYPNSNTSPSPVAAEAAPQSSKNSKKKVIIIGIVVVVVVLLSATGLFLYRYFSNNNKNSDDIDPMSLLVEPPEISEDDDTEYEPEESFEDPESYVQHLWETINEATEAEEDYNARMALADYYISVEYYADARTVLEGLNTNGFSIGQYCGYYNVMSRLYYGLGDTEKYNEYSALAADYLNMLQQSAISDSIEE